MTDIGRRREYTDDVPPGSQAWAEREKPGGRIVVHMSPAVPAGERAEAERKAVLQLLADEHRRGLGVLLPVLLALIRYRPRAAAALAGALTTVTAGAALMLPAPAPGHVSPRMPAPGPAPALASRRIPERRGTHPPARRAPVAVPVTAPAKPPPSPVVSVHASAGVDRDRTGRDAAAYVDLASQQARQREITLRAPDIVPPLPAPVPVVKVAGCINGGRLLRACGHVSVLPHPSIGPGSQQDP